MRAVDTNVLVRLIARDDSHQTEAAQSAVERGAWVSHLALAEATWVLAAVYDRAPAEIASAVEMLLNHQTLMIQADLPPVGMTILAAKSGWAGVLRQPTVAVA